MHNNEKVDAWHSSMASVERGAGLIEKLAVAGRYVVKCFGPDGALKWEDTIDNLVTNVGKNLLLDSLFNLAAAQTSRLMGLISSTGFSAVAAGDTMASHPGWLEAGAANAPTYTAPRPVPAFGAAAAGVKSTSVAVAFAITGTGIVKGCFIVFSGTNAIDNATGVLYSAGLFTNGDKNVSNLDTLNVSYSASV